MYGAILGDMIGSPYEFDKGNKTKKIPLFSKKAHFTDDTVMTIAVAEALLDVGSDANREIIHDAVTHAMQKWGRMYPYAGYGSMFCRWIKAKNPKPYGSFGNGSAMRVSSVGWLYDLPQAREVSRWTAEVTHNHPEGIKGAEAVASAICLARRGKTKVEIKSYIESEFGYDLSRTLDEIRPAYHMDVSCQGSVPEAIIAFLEGLSFEDTVRNAVSIGGDTDTIACIAGSIAEAYYGLSTECEVECLRRIPAEFRRVILRFESLVKREVMDNGRMIEAPLSRYEHDEEDNPQEVIAALTAHLHNGGYLRMPSGAVALMDSIRTKENYTDVPWLLAFTSNDQYLEWHLWPDEMNWVPAWEEDYDRADVTDVKLHEILSCIAKAQNEDAAVVLNQEAFFITPQMAQVILSNDRYTDAEPPIREKISLMSQ